MHTATLWTARIMVMDGPLIRRAGLRRMLSVITGDRVRGSLAVCTVMDAMGCCQRGWVHASGYKTPAYHDGRHPCGHCPRQCADGDNGWEDGHCHQTLSDAVEGTNYRGFLWTCVVVCKMSCFYTLIVPILATNKLVLVCQALSTRCAAS